MYCVSLSSVSSSPESAQRSEARSDLGFGGACCAEAGGAGAPPEASGGSSRSRLEIFRIAACSSKYLPY
jgi:hypothetical protein